MSHSSQNPQSGWSVRTIAVAVFPLAWGAAAVNVFFASLIGSWIGGPVLDSGWSLGLGAVVAIPASLAFARHIRTLMDRADGSRAHEERD